MKGLLQDLREAVSNGKPLEARAKSILGELLAWSQVSRSDIAGSIHQTQVIGELRYGGKTLATNLVLHDAVNVAIVVCPYSGGHLAEDAFSFVEYVRDPSSPPLETLLLVHEPPLTRAERAAMRLVPKDHLEAAVGINIDGMTTPLEVAILLGALALGVYMAHKVEVAYENYMSNNEHDADDGAANVGGAGAADAYDDAAANVGGAGAADAYDDAAADVGGAGAANEADEAAEDVDDAENANDDDDDGAGEYSFLDERIYLYASQHLSEVRLKQLGPSASARELISMRRAVLARGRALIK